MISLIAFVLHAAFAQGLDLPVLSESKSPIFQTRKTFEARLEADFKTLFAKVPTLAKPKGRQSDDSDAAYVNGRLIYRNETGSEIVLPLRLRARGNSSLTDCSFNKLELEFTGPRDGTLFEKMKRVKIGTHCDDVDGNSGKFNRLRNQLSPIREALAYHLVEVLGVNTFKTRPASLTYVFTDDAIAKSHAMPFF